MTITWVDGHFLILPTDEELHDIDIEASARGLTREEYLMGCIEVGRWMQ